jgi:hypothetical protein
MTIGNCASQSEKWDHSFVNGASNMEDINKKNVHKLSNI